MENKGKLAWAMYIDQELRSVFVEMANKVAEQGSVGNSSTLKPEITALVDIIYFTLSYYVTTQQTPGMTIFNLEQNPSYPKRNPIYLITYITYCWALQRTKYVAMMQGWRNSQNDRYRKAYKCLQVIDTMAKILTLVNTLKFLYSGDYPSLIYRVMNCQMVNKQSLNKGHDVDNRYLIPGLSAIQVSVKYRQIFIAILTATLSAGARAINWPVLFRNTRLLLTNTMTKTNVLLTNIINNTVYQVTKQYNYTLHQSKSVMRMILRLALRHRPWLQRFLHVWYPSLLLFAITSSPSTSSSSLSSSSSTFNSADTSNQQSQHASFPSAPPIIASPTTAAVIYICGICKSTSPEMPHIIRTCRHVFCYLCIIPTVLLATKQQQSNAANRTNSNSNNGHTNNSSSSTRNSNSNSMYNFFQFQDNATNDDDDDDDDDNVAISTNADSNNNNNNDSDNNRNSYDCQNPSSAASFQCPVCAGQQPVIDCQPYHP